MVNAQLALWAQLFRPSGAGVWKSGAASNFLCELYWGNPLRPPGREGRGRIFRHV